MWIPIHGDFKLCFQISGGSGFLGQHIVKLLQEKDDVVGEIRVLDLKPYVKHLGNYTDK